MPAIAILSISVLAFTFLLWHRNNDRQRDDVGFVPGPDSDSVLVGNMHTLVSSPSDTAARAWSKQYGGLVRLHGILGVRRYALLISDPAALRQLFSTSSSFDMSSRNLSTFKTLFGPGVAGVDGPDHLRQRRIISQALTPAKVRGMLEPVQAVSKNFMAAMRTHCAQTAECTSRIDMLEWARRCALDSLTSVAFGVSLNAIDRPEQSHDILHAFDAMLEDCIGKTSAAKYFLRETAAAGIYPSLLALALVDLQFFRSMLGTSKRLGKVGRWVRSTRETLGESESGNDLLSLLEKANNEDSKYKLTDEEIQAQINMVMFAGHDTVSVTFAMFMNDMANYPEIQARLRDEILAKHAEIGGDDVPFSQDDYESMPYLNAVLKESMRLNPSLGITFRTNRADEVLPLSEPILCTDGQIRDKIAMSADTFVVIDMASSNRRKDVWGDDAESFIPERWLRTQESAVPLAQTPGATYGSILNFLAGNRTCPGWRVAVLELHTFICDILQNFRISPVPGVTVVREFHGVSIPKVLGKVSQGGEVPLMLEAV